MSTTGMPEPSGPRRESLATGLGVGVVLWYGLLAVAAIALTVAGQVSTGVALTGTVLALAPVALLLAGLMGSDRSGTLEAKMQHLIGAVEQTTRESGLSEGAKRVLHRREERELLRRAIEQDITDEDWDAAMVLVKELAERFGYRADAEEFRERIERARAQTLDRKVLDAVAALDEHVRAARWVEAYAEAARIRRLYPESHRIDGLRERVDQARKRHAKELEARFVQAAEREDVDQAMDLLKEMDAYLTPTEAEPYAQMARRVISQQRDNLIVRFRMMVQEKQWSDAAAVGEKIIADFPNSRMAAEAREMLPTLRERAEQAGARR